MHASLTFGFTLSLLLAGYTTAECLFPEPTRQICYDTPGAKPQDLNPKEIDYVARYLRSYQAQVVKDGGSPFWRMPVADAGGCAEWQVTTKDGTWVMAKLVGNEDAAITFNDIANTIDGGGADTSEEAIAKSLMNCGTAGGQMGVIVNATDPLYESDEFVDGGYTNSGIIIKLVHNPDN